MEMDEWMDVITRIPAFQNDRRHVTSRSSETERGSERASEQFCKQDRSTKLAELTSEQYEIHLLGQMLVSLLDHLASRMEASPSADGGREQLLQIDCCCFLDLQDRIFPRQLIAGCVSSSWTEMMILRFQIFSQWHPRTCIVQNGLAWPSDGYSRITCIKKSTLGSKILVYFGNELVEISPAQRTGFPLVLLARRKGERSRRTVMYKSNSQQAANCPICYICTIRVYFLHVHPFTGCVRRGLFVSFARFFVTVSCQFRQNGRPIFREMAVSQRIMAAVSSRTYVRTYVRTYMLQSACSYILVHLN